MPSHRTLKVTVRLTVSRTLWVLTAITLALALDPTPPAQAMPDNQDSCETKARGVDTFQGCGLPECFTRLPEQRITLSASLLNLHRRCLLTFSTEYSSPQADTGLQLAYSVDGGACAFRDGPRVIAPALLTGGDTGEINHGTTTLVSRIIFVDQDAHTIEPCLQQIEPGAPSSVGNRCFFIECLTQ